MHLKEQVKNTTRNFQHDFLNFHDANRNQEIFHEVNADKHNGSEFVVLSPIWKTEPTTFSNRNTAFIGVTMTNWDIIRSMLKEARSSIFYMLMVEDNNLIYIHINK